MVNKKVSKISKERRYMSNYILKSFVIQNGCCKLLRKKSLSEWKISQYQSQYKFIYEGLSLFGEIDGISYNDLIQIDNKLAKAKEFYLDTARQLTSYSPLELQEAERVNSASYKRTKRLKEKMSKLLQLENSIFLTLTFTDSVLASTSEATRKKYVQRYLKEYCQYYIANIDYGSINEREHYHAVIIPKTDKIYLKPWTDNYGGTKVKRIHLDNNKNNNENSSARLSKYINKLTNHAIKESTHQNRIIYSRDTIN